MTLSFGDRLAHAVREKKSVAVIGLDLRLDRLPPALVARPAQTPESVLEPFVTFGVGILDAVADLVPAVKPNIAFFEAFGNTGLIAYNQLCAEARNRGLLVVGDVKRGDIGSTAEAYAQGLLTCPEEVEGQDEHLTRQMRLGPHDALTLNPYLGTDSVEPFRKQAEAGGQGLFVLVRTSNPSSDELQTLPLAAGGTVADAAARLVDDWGGPSREASETGISSVGAVVGATHPKEMDHFRNLMPHAPFLVPGYGAQGGSADDVVDAFLPDGTGALVNASRSVLYAWQQENAPEDWKGAARRAAEAMNADLRGALERAGRWSF